MRFIRSIIIGIKLRYYLFLEFVEDELSRNQGSLGSGEVIERAQENTKLKKGVKKLVERLRGMSFEDRIETENLLGKGSYKKTSKEKLDELRVLDKVNRNPILITEDDLVNTVVKLAPQYAIEAELKEVRKAITACLRLASSDPDNPTHTINAMALKADLARLKGDIARMKRNG